MDEAKNKNRNLIKHHLAAFKAGGGVVAVEPPFHTAPRTICKTKVLASPMTAKQIADAVQSYLDGDSVRVLSNRYSTGSGTLYRHLEKAGIERRSNHALTIERAAVMKKKSWDARK